MMAQYCQQVITLVRGLDLQRPPNRSDFNREISLIHRTGFQQTAFLVSLKFSVDSIPLQIKRREGRGQAATDTEEGQEGIAASCKQWMLLKR